MTSDGLQVSASAIQRLEKKRKYSKDLYDSLKINQLTNHGKEDDPARRKKEDQHLVDLRRQINQYDAQILEIKLSLKDSIWVLEPATKMPKNMSDPPFQVALLPLTLLTV